MPTFIAEIITVEVIIFDILLRAHRISLCARFAKQLGFQVRNNPNSPDAWQL